MNHPIWNYPAKLRTRLGLLLILTSLILGSCATASAGMAVSNIPLENRKYEILGPAETTVNWVTIDFGILGFPLSAPPVDDAIQQLLTEKEGDALINIRYWTDRSILLFVTVNRFHIQADVVKLLD